MMTETTTTMTTDKKKGRGRGKRQNPLYSLLVLHPDRASERTIVCVSGREDDSIEERHRRLLEMEQYCFTHDILYQWYLASPLRSEERMLYLVIESAPSRAWSNVRCQVSRLKLSSKQVAMRPEIGETTAPPVSTTQEREEVQV